MKQNIFGVILFSIIVGTAVYVSSSSVVLPTPPAVEERPVWESKNTCRKTASPVMSKIQVSQAVLNPRTNQLDTSLLVERFNPAQENFGITYHFFVKDGGSARYLASETFGIKPNFQGNTANHEVLSSYQWLDTLKSQENLYLISETNMSPFGRNSYTVPRFDENNAVPVLLMKGKN